jgi:hypothetical protein
LVKVNKQQQAFQKLKLIKYCKNLAKALCFDKQMAFIEDPSKRKALFCSRRAGKSTAIGIFLLMNALLYPKRTILYIASTKQSAERIIWRDVIQPQLLKLKKLFGYSFTFNRNTRIITLQNGSHIYLTGIDNPKEADRLLGGKYHMAVIDECEIISQDFDKIFRSLEPALADYLNSGGGTIVLAGTPGDLMGEHYWFQVTKTLPDGNPDPKRMTGWSVHSWHTPDNPYMRSAYLAMVAEKQKTDANYEQDPSWISQWKCQWILEKNAAVYKYTEAKNLLKTDLPRNIIIQDSLFRTDPKWTYLMGVDLGWHDETAFVIGAYSFHEPNFYIIESVSMDQIPYSEIAGMCCVFKDKYHLSRIVMDTAGAAKILAESLSGEYGLPVIAAQKKEKENHIGKMNSDFRSGRIQVIPQLNNKLIDEWAKLEWNHKSLLKGKAEEGEKWRNHLADAALYCWRESLHEYASPPVEPKTKTMADILLEQAEKERAEQQEGSFAWRDDNPITGW